jgi:hypothetical protein
MRTLIHILSAQMTTLGRCAPGCASARRSDKVPGASPAVLLFYTFPVVTLGVERFCFKQHVALSVLLCVIVIFMGAALIAVPGLHNGTIDPRGLAWAVPGPIIYAFYWRPMPAC